MDLHDGMLSIGLIREIPEAIKLREISIGGGGSGQRERTIEGSTAQPELADA